MDLGARSSDKQLEESLDVGPPLVRPLSIS